MRLRHLHVLCETLQALLDARLVAYCIMLMISAFVRVGALSPGALSPWLNICALAAGAQKETFGSGRAAQVEAGKKGGAISGEILW